MKLQSRNIPLVQRLTMAALLGTLPSMVEGQTTVTRSDMIRVAARNIPRGAVLTASDIAYEKKDIPTAHTTPHSVFAADVEHQPATANDSMVGWTTRRMIAIGEPLKAPAVLSPRLIVSGEMVDVIWSQGAVVVSAKGHATRAAGANEKIEVRLDAQRVVEGTVVAPGRVRVD